MGSTSKTVAPGLSMGLVVSVGKKPNICGVVSLRRVSRTYFSACPSRLEPRQVLGEKAR